MIFVVSDKASRGGEAAADPFNGRALEGVAGIFPYNCSLLIILFG
ncbi:MAG TPA: hypothetical protein VIZ87_02030 [Terrimicrobium sp.]